MTDRKTDRKLIADIPQKNISEFIFLQLRNLWAVDGLYFIGIEERFGTDAATEIDSEVWKIMGKIEARRLKQFLNLEGKKDIPSIMNALQHSSWALDLEDKEIVVENSRGVIRNVACRVQNTRKKKGLSEFPCKQVRWGFLKAFTQEFNPEIIVSCNMCPPDPHPENLWCEWVFTYDSHGDNK